MKTTHYRRAALTVLATAALAITLAPGTAQATETRSPHCDYIALENVKIRTGPSTGNTALGMLAKGDRIDCDSKSEVGGRYDDCGGGDLWNSVNYQGRRAWVAADCVRWDPA